jgi:hypothetical protein
VAHEHDGQRPEIPGRLVEQVGQVTNRSGVVAVPAAEPEPGPVDHDLAAAQRVPDSTRDRPHPQHAELHRAGRLPALGTSAVHHDHDPDGAAEAADGMQ